MVLAFTLISSLVACSKGEAPAPAATEPGPAAEAAAPAAPAASKLDGEVYGAGVSLTESTPVSKLLADVDAYNGKTVRVEGLVTEVCEKRGCWMNIAGDEPFQNLRFKVQDGEITIPVSAKGKYAVAEGTISKVELSKEDALAMREHEAEEQGKPVDESAPLPTFSVKLAGKGAVIRERM